jgi:hypothetical protein
MPPTATRAVETIRWCSLVSGQKGFVRSALQDLADGLDRHYPQLPKVTLQELAPSEQAQVPLVLARAMCHPETFDTWPHRPLFVFCEREAEYAAAIRNENEKAAWGGARQGEFAVAWVPDNKYLVWHEALHLLFATDCYETSDSRPCDEPRCVMQLDPTGENCGHELYLCPKNLGRIVANYS